jgi:putative heme degradation protein
MMTKNIYRFAANTGMRFAHVDPFVMQRRYENMSNPEEFQEMMKVSNLTRHQILFVEQQVNALYLEDFLY